MDQNFDELRASAADALHMARVALDAQINTYPTPISGCDAQFTYLLAERRRLRNAVAALEADIFIPTPRTLTPGTGVESR